MLDLEHLSATICAELACGLSKPADIRQKYGITTAQWNQLKSTAVFRSMLAEAMAEWAGDLNAGKRIVKKSEIMLEDSLGVLYQIAHDKEAPRQVKIDSVKTMAVLAGKTNQKGEAAGAGGGQRGAVINIAIVTKDQEKRVVIESTSNLLDSSAPLALEADVSQ